MNYYHIVRKEEVRKTGGSALLGTADVRQAIQAVTKHIYQESNSTIWILAQFKEKKVLFYFNIALNLILHSTHETFKIPIVCSKQYASSLIAGSRFSI